MKILRRLLQRKIDHIGLDIGSFSIKMVELKKGDEENHHEVLTYGMARIPANALVDGAIKDVSAVTKALLELKDEGKLKSGATLNVAVSGKHVITRTLKLPVMPLDELDQALEFEADKYIPTPIDQLYLDYSILGEVTVDNAPHYNLLLAAVPKDIINTYCRVLEEAKLNPYGIEIEPLALYRLWYSYYYDETLKNQAILNMGHSNCHLVVFKEDNIQFTRTIPIAGLQMTEAIIQSAGKEVAAAIDLKHKQKLNQDNVIELASPESTDDYSDSLIVQSISDTLGSLTQEIQRSIDFYQMQAKVRLDRLIITGGCAELQGLDTTLEAELGLPVLVGVYGELDPSFSLASGLAMRDFMKL
ncbi:type IV pilus assembly protein PilM [Desulfuribacillus alkaliarsenatis]|uniref:SHS2 domain-containing protein n=1 Tax=Desulfuribacillus alkaliarsenatis TaxID=766136 RepID=A0A1E5G5E3_9FIRM|nr:type IV pilus assembly protein PilM [Desulfuribacillus alkaliarsenatis]OEF98329.1 hypothetical protein BHF68_01220 [Desulfuribacillus alkaliarsenatis]